MKNRAAAGLFALILCLFAALSVKTAFADSIYQPEDDFYYAHQDKIKLTDGDDYIAIGPNGQAKGYLSPEKDTVNLTVKNGDHVMIYAIFTDERGLEWGLTETVKMTDGKREYLSAWFPMLYLNDPFNEAMFINQYESEVYVYDTWEDVAILAMGEWMLYRYPGDTEGVKAEKEQVLGTVTAQYKDSEGRAWVRYTNSFGNTQNHIWVCSDAPTLSFHELFPEGFTVDKRLQDAYFPGDEIRPENRTVFKYMFYILLGLSVAGMITAAILVNVGMARKYKKKT